MNQHKRQKNGLLYKSSGTMIIDRWKARFLLRFYNRMLPFDMVRAIIVYRLLGIKAGLGTFFEPPFRCDYGKNIKVGKMTYINTGCTILDTNTVSIGNNVLIAPNVSIFTAGHPIDPEIRKTSYEYALPITIEDNVWIGGNSIILPGVTIGKNSVIGAGSVVTKDIPENVIAVGNPCKVIRAITDEDKKYAYKDQKIDLKGLIRIKALVLLQKFI
ncbi:MAG: sugar O-acetyltransferase [Oscillospiraceae bacterium]|nr:sugar O-acetyltransferase [Oscillospiraceae bacterium]